MGSGRRPAELEGLGELGPADHVCWVVGSDDDYDALATACVADGRAAGDKVFVFGPDAGARPDGDVVADPFVIGLDRGPLRPAAMLDMFRRESAAAVAEAYRGVRVVADMDWVLAAGPTADDVTAFEIELDGLIAELDATVVCAYRQSTFADRQLAALAAVHPQLLGPAPGDTGLRIWRREDGSWGVAGEIDVANVATFALALATLGRPHSRLTLSLGGLDFIDVAGMSALADVASSTPGLQVRLVDANPVFRRCWQLVGFDTAAAGVELAS